MGGTYAWSFDGEWYEGSFASIREAFDAAAPQSSERPVWVGEMHAPAAEEYVDADLVLDHITCQDEYSLEAADDWPGATKEQRQELTEALQKTVGEWLDRHKLRENFFLVRDAKEYVMEDGELVEWKGK